MIAEAGGTRKVIGNRIATPLTEPSPGIAPMNRPSVTPTMISHQVDRLERLDQAAAEK